MVQKPDKQSAETVVKVSGVSKNFALPHEKVSSMKGYFTRLFNMNRSMDVQHALRDISFEIKKGEFFGIVGRNGSGKSTLLKILSEIYQPTKGSVAVNGKLVPFIELGVGFNPELTGRENVYLNGALLGFSKKEVDGLYDGIVEFAELHSFMDQKLKNYSSGMQVRLAFSIAIRANSDILVLDEVLAVGDEAFKRKCNDYFERIRKDKSKTVVLVTHDMDSVRKYCSRAMMLRDGNKVIYGNPEDVSNEYSMENLNTSTSKDDEASENSSLIKNLKVSLLSKKQITQDDKLELKISYNVPTKINTRIRVSLQDLDRNVPVFAASSPVVNKDKVSMTLRARLDSINDTAMKVLVSIRGDKEEVLHFLPDNLAPVLALKRTDYPDPTRKNTWALLFDRGEWR